MSDDTDDTEGTTQPGPIQRGFRDIVEYDPAYPGDLSRARRIGERSLDAPPPPMPLASITAAASRLTTAKIKRLGQVGKPESWQEDAWDMYDLVGEERFLAHTLAARMAQARFFVGRLPKDPTEDIEVITDGLPYDVFETLGGRGLALSQIVERLGINLFIAGDGYLIGAAPKGEEGETAGPGDPRAGLPPLGRPTDGEAGTSTGGRLALDGVDLASLDWMMRSVDEVEFNTGGNDGTVTLRGPGKQRDTWAADDILTVRVWRPHPRWWWQADSPTRSSLPVLREIVGLTMHISAQVDSRLAGAGMLLIPASADRAIRAAAGLPEGDDSTSPLVEALMEAMITPIGDRSSASALVPLTVTVPDEAVEKFRHITFSNPLDAEARNLRDEAIRRLALGQDCPPELLLGVGCVDTETDIYTRDGWRRHDEVGVGTEVLTLDHETGMARWEPILVMNRFDVVDAPMLRMESGAHDSLTTMEHRWPVVAHGGRRWTTSEDGFKAADRVPVAAPLDPEQEPAAAKWDDDFVRLLVAYTADGTRLRHGNLRVTKFSDREVVEARRIFTSLYGVGGFREEPHPTHTADGVSFILRKEQAAPILNMLGEHKEIPAWFVDELTAAQRLLFLDSAVAIGDGVSVDPEATVLYQAESSRLVAFERAALLSGMKVTRGVREPGKGFSDRPLYWVRWSRSRVAFAPWYAASERVSYTGTVWCPTTATGTWLARRNGLSNYTGNSLNHWGAWLVREDVVTTHLEPPLALVCDALTTQFLWLVLEQANVPDFEDYVIWYDVDHLIMRPDRSADAKDLHGYGVLSDAALRDATGFDESDAPEEDPTDPAVAMALDLVRGAPSLLQNPGLDVIVAQIRAVLDGTEIPPVPAALPPAGEEPAAPVEDGEPSTPEEGPPDTEGADDQRNGPGLAASAVEKAFSRTPEEREFLRGWIKAAEGRT